MTWPAYFHIFPLRQGSKEPFGGFHWPAQASNDPAQWATWAREYPGCNWALACGPSNVLVFDVEYNGLEWLDQQTRLKPDMFGKAPLVATPRGGRHVYFRGRGRSTVKAIHPCVDTRGEGGYVVLPGSKLSNGEYRMVRGSFEDIAEEGF